MKKLNLLLLLLSLILSAFGYSQTTEFTVHKASSTFTYNNKPITPEALLPFLPGMEDDDTIRPYLINLKDSVYKYTVLHDSPYYRCFLDYPGSENYNSESVGYQIIAKTNDNKFITEVYRHGNGTLYIIDVFIFKIVDGKIYKLGYFAAEPSRLRHQVIVKGNEIINGAIHYKIPD